MNTAVIQKAILLNKEGHLLAIKRSATDVRRPLQWDLPGGWLDEGESFEQGIRREIKEETGITAVSQPRLVFSKTEIRTWQEGEDANRQGNCVFLFYLVDCGEENIVLSYEHVAYEWMSLDKALQNFAYPLQKAAFAHIVVNKLA